MRKAILLTATIIPMLAGCDMMKISDVKKNHLAYCESYSIEEVMDKIMTDVKWSVVENGTEFPYIIADGKRANGRLYEPARFVFVGSETGLIEVVEYEINGNKHNSITAPWIFADVCSDEYLRHLKNGVVGIGGMLNDTKDKLINTLEQKGREQKSSDIQNTEEPSNIINTAPEETEE